MGIIFSLIVGGIAGFLAGTIMNSKNDMIVNVIIGLIGSAVGSFLFRIIGLQSTGGILGEIIIATVGAVTLLYLGKKLKL
jgi:uncharacterized membrane protein YeaQ/YmgE (transglycosylase-associated protein family)